MGHRYWTAIWPIIALAFPVLEMVGIYRIWQEAGFWTLLWLFVAGVLGFALIAAERVAFLPRLAESMLTGTHPFELVFTSGQRFLAGILLILPGAISDVVAVLLLLRAGWSPPPPPRRPGPMGPRQRPANDDVIEGDFSRVD